MFYSLLFSHMASSAFPDTHAMASERLWMSLQSSPVLTSYLAQVTWLLTFSLELSVQWYFIGLLCSTIAQTRHLQLRVLNKHNNNISECRCSTYFSFLMWHPVHSPMYIPQYTCHGLWETLDGSLSSPHKVTWLLTFSLGVYKNRVQSYFIGLLCSTNAQTNHVRDLQLKVLNTTTTSSWVLLTSFFSCGIPYTPRYTCHGLWETLDVSLSSPVLTS